MKGNHTVEKFNIIYRSTGEILFKLSKIINLKTLLKNKDKFKRTKVTSISELTGKICGGRWRSFARKSFRQSKRMGLQLEIWEGTENLPMKSKERGFGKTWNSCLPEAMISNFLSL